MQKLSLAIITFNEQANIARCISSVGNLADEVLVVDSGSTDKTVQIAKELGARVIHQDFLGHIEQKNLTLNSCKHDLVLSLDADEALDDNLLGAIKQLKEQKHIADAYLMNRLTNYCGKWIKHCDWYPDRKIRLWNRKKGHWGGQNPHDKVEMQPGATVLPLKGNILHYSYFSIHQHIDQANKFSTIVALQRYRAGKKTSVFKTFVSPVWRFLRMYFIKAGFLDGYYGLVVCAISAFANYAKEVKLMQLRQGHVKPNEMK